MRKVLYAVILLSLFFAPVERVSVGKLLPIRAVAVYWSGNQVVLETDTQNVGQGETVADALLALKENTPAVVFLDTAEYLFVAPDAEECKQYLLNHMKASVKVYIFNAANHVEDAANYADVHGVPTEIHGTRTK